MISVVVCDDHGIIRSGIARLLEATDDFELVASAPTGELLLQAVRDFTPDLVVLDIRLTDCSGLDLLKQVLAIAPDLRVVMLSMYSARGYIEKAKAEGARGYITKECLDEELVSVLQAVMTEDGFISFRSAEPEKRLEVDIDLLSSRELEVMVLIASGLTNAEIAEKLTVSPRTVESHRASIQRKLLIRTRAELAVVARNAFLLE
ncbi:DNA-binding response regulator [Nocardioides gansuensis]|uniref:DNA-binding response regulator n=1 Tax=Nocardioides gansuensis TaxID=2138300 RepID=A0A2T8FBW3_9ACTN|nr:response regulator transcription factor [Nocardioides gansuensis]PVG83186.1 DNA-binding response regulator [Nocardioides gansuensis]